MRRSALAPSRRSLTKGSVFRQLSSMYKIIGADGKEYGPIPLDQFRQWIAENRVNERSSLVCGQLCGGKHTFRELCDERDTSEKVCEPPTV